MKKETVYAIWDPLYKIYPQTLADPVKRLFVINKRMDEDTFKKCFDTQLLNEDRRGLNVGTSFLWVRKEFISSKNEKLLN